MVDYFETYIYTAGALAIVVLTIEVRSAPNAPAEHLKLTVGSRPSDICVSAALRHGLRHVFIQRDPVSAVAPPAVRRRAVKYETCCTVIVYVSHWSCDITLYFTAAARR